MLHCMTDEGTPSAAQTPTKPQTPPQLERPRVAVSVRDRRRVERRTIDVHGARADVPLRAPVAALQRLADWLSPSFYVDFGRPCNSACVYCAVPPHEDAQGFASLDEVAAMVRAGAAVGCDRTILIGGEPTIYPHLDAVFDLLDDAGLRGGHIAMTNGLKLADAAFLDHLIARGLKTVHFSLDTLDGGLYDRIARSSGKHPRQLTALQHVLERSADGPDAALHVYIYTAVTRWNASRLPELVEGVAAMADTAGRAPPPIVLAVVKPLGDALRHADTLQLSPQQGVDAVRAAMDKAAALDVPIGHRNLQACLAPELIAHNVDYYLDDHSVVVQSREREPFAHTEYWHKPPAVCGGCGHEALCWGIYHEIERRFGLSDFGAIGRVGLKGP